VLLVHVFLLREIWRWQFNVKVSLYLLLCVFYSCCCLFPVQGCTCSMLLHWLSKYMLSLICACQFLNNRGLYMCRFVSQYKVYICNIGLYTMYVCLKSITQIASKNVSRCLQRILFSTGTFANKYVGSCFQRLLFTIGTTH